MRRLAPRNALISRARHGLRRGYSRAIAGAIAASPTPVWRWPAIPSATAATLIDRELRALAPEALRALGRAPTRAAQLRFRWGICYQAEVEQVLALQQERLDRAWLRRHVILEGALPPEGAILLTVHHPNVRLSVGLFACAVGRIGAISVQTHERLEHHLRSLERPPELLLRRALGPHVFPPAAVRRSLRFLRQGGYLIVAADEPHPAWPRASVLGRQLPLAPGIAWLARRSGRPIVPFVLIPERRRWRIRCGAPIAATDAAIADAVERCIRSAPVNWSEMRWKIWGSAPRTGAVEVHSPSDPPLAAASR